jgi:transposase InsO family protein
MFLQQFNFKVQYRPGTKQSHVDVFTRNTVWTEFDSEIDDKIGVRVSVFCARANTATQADEFVIELSDNESDEAPQASVDLLTSPKFPSPDVWKTEVQNDKAQVDAHKLVVIDGIAHKGDKLYVPVSLRETLIHFFHRGVVGLHQGIQRTYARIRRNFWWPNMLKDIQKDLDRCLTCRRRRVLVKEPGSGHLFSATVFGRISMDIFKADWKTGDFSILTMIDHATKYSDAHVVREATAGTVWRRFYIHWICRFGVPVEVLTDNGPSFVSEMFEANCRGLGIRVLHSAPYHPQGNGVIEAFHNFLKRGLSAQINTNIDIKVAIANALFAFRSTPHPAVKDSPYRLLTGLDMTLPSMNAWQQLDFSQSNSKERLETIEVLRQDALQEMYRKLVRREEGISKDNIQEGDLVIYAYTPHDLHRLHATLGTKKLLPAWSEPCRVVKRSPGMSTVVVRSIWHDNDERTLPIRHLQKLPEDYYGDEAELLNLDQCKEAEAEWWNVAKHEIPPDEDDSKEDAWEAKRKRRRRDAFVALARLARIRSE